MGVEQSRIERISELTRISRTRSLTPEEQAERKTLREEYLASIRGSLERELENTYLVEPDGTKHHIPKKLK